jgi:hypothetical protein
MSLLIGMGEPLPFDKGDLEGEGRFEGDKGKSMRQFWKLQLLIVIRLGLLVFFLLVFLPFANFE